MRNSVFFAIVTSFLFSTQFAGAEDWRQFRGFNASGVSNDPNLPKTWGVSENIRWKVDIEGDAWSSPIVTDGKVFLTNAVTGGSQSIDSNYRWELICLDAKTGSRVWTKLAMEGKPRLNTHRDNTYASETPVTDGKLVVAYFGMMGLFCYDLDGELIWKKDLGQYPMNHEWGTSSSPALLDGKVYLQIDNEEASFVIALDIATGEELWKQPRAEGSNWGSPIIWENDKRRELVTGGSVVRSYEPADGTLLWQVDIQHGGLNATPSATSEQLVVGRDGRGGTSFFSIRSGGSGNLSKATFDELESPVMWSTQKFGPNRASPLVSAGYVYLLGGGGGKITIADAATGALVQQARLPGAGEFWASPWANGGFVYCLDASGKTFAIKPGPTLDVVAVNILTDNDRARFWSSPAISDGTIFIRSDEALFAIAKPQ
ncbi:MAG: PQQ-binding-like beta-propeller repeat protein [Aureliella sp.]